MISPVGAPIRRIMVSVRRVLPALLLFCALPASASAATEREAHGGGPVAEARKAHGSTRPADRVADGAITVEPTEGLAGLQRTVRVTLAAGEGAVDLSYPSRFSDRTLNGHAFVPGLPTGRTLDASSRSATIDVSGLPAGTYRLPVRRGGRLLGTAVFRLYAQRKEGDEGENQLRRPFGRLGRNTFDASNDSTDESETFVVAEPDNTLRFAAYGNDSTGGTGGLF